jgi:hypothetical protein
MNPRMNPRRNQPSWSAAAFAFAASLVVAGPVLAQGAQPPPKAPAPPSPPAAPAPPAPPEMIVVRLDDLNSDLADLEVQLQDLGVALEHTDGRARERVNAAMDRVRARLEEQRAKLQGHGLRMDPQMNFELLRGNPFAGGQPGLDDDSVRVIVEDALRSQLDSLNAKDTLIRRGGHPGVFEFLQAGAGADLAIAGAAAPAAPKGWFDNDELAEMQSLEIFNQVYGGTLDMMRKTRTLASDADMSAIFSIHRVEDIADSEEEAEEILSQMLETATSPTVRRALTLKVAELRENLGDKAGALELYKGLIMAASQEQAKNVTLFTTSDGMPARFATRFNGGGAEAFSSTTSEDEGAPANPAPPAAPNALRVIRRR